MRRCGKVGEGEFAGDGSEGVTTDREDGDGFGGCRLGLQRGI